MKITKLKILIQLQKEVFEGLSLRFVSFTE